MRVLGDVDAAPEIDTAVHEVRAGDRWLLCSDGLSSYVSEEKIASILQTVRTAQGAADRLVKESLDHGAPDNVTVVITDIDDSQETGAPPAFVGSASAPLSFESDTTRRPIRLPTLLLHPLKSSAPEDSHFEPEREGYLEELIEEDRRRARRRRIVWLVLIAAYQWTQSHYYVGVDDGKVAIFQGVQQTIGPIELSHVFQPTTIEVADLPTFQRESVEATINADDLRKAIEIVNNLSDLVEQ
jgi:protein phosphatase